MSARATIIVQRRRNVLRLPAHAVEGDGADATVMVASATHKDGKTVTQYKKRKIVAGLRGDTFIEIVSGLKRGEKVKPGVFKGPRRKAIDLRFGGEASAE